MRTALEVSVADQGRAAGQTAPAEGQGIGEDAPRRGQAPAFPFPREGASRHSQPGVGRSSSWGGAKHGRCWGWAELPPCFSGWAEETRGPGLAPMSLSCSREREPTQLRAPLPWGTSPQAGETQKVHTYLGNLEWPDDVGGKRGEHLLHIQGAQRGVRADARVVDEQVQALVLQMRPHSLHGPSDAGQVHCVCRGKKQSGGELQRATQRLLESVLWPEWLSLNQRYPERMDQV